MTGQPDPKDGPLGQNTDRELWRERVGDYYADSIFVTESGGIGINAGGMVYVKPLREWHRLASYSVDFPSISRVVPPEGGPRADELEAIRQSVVAICDPIRDPDDEALYVIRDEDGEPIVEAETLSDAIAQIISCWNECATVRASRAGTRQEEPVAPDIADELREMDDALNPNDDDWP